jgi:uncharacterized RDD family membrane protein YckC
VECFARGNVVFQYAMQQDPNNPGSPYYQGAPQQYAPPAAQAGMAGAPPYTPAGYPVPLPGGHVAGAAPLPESAYGSFLARFAALLIDGLIVGFAVGLLWVVGTAVVVPLSVVLGDTVGAILSILVAIVGIPLSIAMPVLYHMFLETSPRQATFGKQAMGLRLITVEGRTLTRMQSVGRCLVRYLLSGAFLGVGYFLALFTERKQALHDLILNTIVVKG